MMMTVMNDLHNGSHRLPGYFEWWYFHFVTAEGAALNLVLHETDIFGLLQEPYISMTVHLPGQAPQYYRQSLASKDIGHGGHYLRVGERMITEDDKRLCLDMPFAGDIRFTAEVTKLAPPLVLNEGLLHEERGTGRKSYWVVPVPHATFTGILQLNGERHRLEGMAYQDHQWGTLCLQEFVSDWVWGHFSNDEAAMFFFQIMTQSGRRVERFAFLEHGRQTFGGLLEEDLVAQIADTTDAKAGQRKLCFDQGGLCFDASLGPAGLMRYRQETIQKDQLATYHRWSASARLSGKTEFTALQGIAEHLQIRPLPKELPETPTP